MNLLEGKKALVFGVANKYSIAWGIAQALHGAGAEVGLSYGIPKLERRVRPLAAELHAEFVEQCDVAEDKDVEALFARAKDHFGKLDILVHSIAFAPTEALRGEFVNTGRGDFATAMDISVYSLIALARAAMPLMRDGGSVLTMTFYGADKVVQGYNVMGVAKAALESSVRYLAAELGADNIRVNAISAGPIKTLAASGTSSIRKMLGFHRQVAPLRRNVDQDEVGKVALWLASDLSSGVTGETVFVDAGYNILGVPVPAAD